MLHGGVRQLIGMLVLALEPNIRVNSTGMSCSVSACRRSHILLVLMIKSLCDVDVESCW
jgi:hypothetical protein